MIWLISRGYIDDIDDIIKDEITADVEAEDGG